MPSVLLRLYLIRFSDSKHKTLKFDICSILHSLDHYRYVFFIFFLCDTDFVCNSTYNFEYGGGNSCLIIILREPKILTE